MRAEARREQAHRRCPGALTAAAFSDAQAHPVLARLSPANGRGHEAGQVEVWKQPYTPGRCAEECAVEIYTQRGREFAGRRYKWQAVRCLRVFFASCFAAAGRYMLQRRNSQCKISHPPRDGSYTRPRVNTIESMKQRGGEFYGI